MAQHPRNWIHCVALAQPLSYALAAYQRLFIIRGILVPIGFMPYLSSSIRATSIAKTLSYETASRKRKATQVLALSPEYPSEASLNLPGQPRIQQQHQLTSATGRARCTVSGTAHE